MDQLFESILRGAVDAGASDIHIKPDAPVVFRVERTLVPVNVPLPGDGWVRSVLDQVVPAELKKRLAEQREIDFAFGLPELGRFRVNAFYQRGQPTIAVRVVKTSVPTFQELNLPSIIQ